MKLSIFLAGIRTNNWMDLYNSIPQVTSIRDYELVFVGPQDLPDDMCNIDNVRYIKDYGCPSRCYQLGVLHSKGEYVVWAADDGSFSPGLAIDKAFDSIPKDRKGVVSLKYFEGPATPKASKQNSDEWWVVRRHKSLNKKCRFAPANYYIVMNALIRRDYMMEIGGFDCRFEHIGIGAVDLAIRLQNDGAKVVLGEKFMDIGHMLDAAGDHGPIYHAHIENDYPLFVKIYNSESSRGQIDFDNWQNAEAVWSRRFTTETTQ
ncbi:MAG: hypothetical protein ACXAC5_00890 [Promethearchaeota archaeon]